MRGHDWGDYEKAAEKSPFSLAVKVIIGLTVLCAFIGVISYTFGWIGEAADVTKKEFGPKALLLKYEWFKNASAELDKKQADIKVYEQRVVEQDKDYAGVLKKDWPRDARETRSQWQNEVAGVKASYNSLAAEYNAQMAKFNWRFANSGELPEGATVPLPRDYKPYVSQ